MFQLYQSNLLSNLDLNITTQHPGYLRVAKSYRELKFRLIGGTDAQGVVSRHCNKARSTINGFMNGMMMAPSKLKAA